MCKKVLKSVFHQFRIWVLGFSDKFHLSFTVCHYSFTLSCSKNVVLSMTCSTSTSDPFLSRKGYSVGTFLTMNTAVQLAFSPWTYLPCSHFSVAIFTFLFSKSFFHLGLLGFKKQFRGYYPFYPVSFNMITAFWRGFSYQILKTFY